MELYERLNELAKSVGSKTKISQNLGITPQKYAGWSNSYSQRNFWELLPSLLTAMPEVSREWLYFEEGEMFRRGDDAKSSHTETIDRQAETIRMQAETIQKLTDELIRRKA